MSRKITKKRLNQMSLVEAVKLSEDSEFITNLFFKLKYKDGYKCDDKDCGSTSFNYINTRSVYQCKKCNNQSTLKSNTIFHDSKIPLKKWFLAIYILTNGANPKVSAIDLSGQLGVSHKCANLIIHKLSFVMLEANESHLLGDYVQIDEAYIGGKDENSKAGKGTSKQSFICAVSLKNNYPTYMKLKINQGNKSDSIVFSNLIEPFIEKSATLVTDGSTSFSLLKQSHDVNSAKVSHLNNKKENTDHLQWVDKVISNLKSYIQGIYHGIDKKYLELYFSLFSWRFNKRKATTMYKIENLIEKCMNFRITTKQDLVNKYQIS